MAALQCLQLTLKRSVWQSRSAWITTVCMGFVVLFSVISVLLTDGMLASFWTRFEGSLGVALLTSESYLNRSDPNGFHQQGFVQDDPSCLSRTQQYTYRQISHIHPIPAAFEGEWHKYGELHRACSRKNWTDFFLKEEQDDRCKFLVYLEGTEGLGNGILSLSSAFAFAFATGRVLLIDSRKNLAKLLCEPFPGSSWVLPDDFPYQTIKSSPALGPFLRSGSNSSVVSLNLQHTMNGEDSDIFCEEAYSSLMNVSWVAWTSNQYFLTNFLLVPSFWQRLQPLFHDAEHIFTFISRFLLLPANDTWAIILREYWSYLSCAKSRLGVQVRLLGRPNAGAFETDAHERIMRCLVGKNFLPTVSNSSENTTQLSNLYTRKAQPGQAGTDVVVLVASLQGKYAETMKEQYSQHPSTDGKMVRVHSASQQGLENKSFHQARLAFVEMWLLSMSDYLATSSFSTFGYIAQGLGGIRPYILSLRKPEEEQLPPCVVGQSIAPCTHFPRKPSRCLGAKAKLSTQHKQWIHNHIYHCQDHQPGWQLVGNSLTTNASADRVAFDFL